MKEILSTQEAAAMTGYSVASIYRLARQKRMPSHKPSGRLIFHASELKEWMNR